MKRSSFIAVFISLCAIVFFAKGLDAASVEPALQQSFPDPLSAEDQKKYDEATNIINVFDGRGNQLEQAYKILTDLGQKYPQSGYPYAGLAELKFRLATMGNGSIDEAYTLAQRALKLDPNIADAYAVIANVMTERNSLFVAQQAADKGISLAPDNPRVMVVKARVAGKLKQYDEAEKWYAKAIERYTDNRRKSNAYMGLGEMREKKKPRDIEGAIQAYEKSVELGDDAPWKLHNVASFLLQYTDRYDQAIEYLNRALKIMDSGAARTSLGLDMYFKWGDAYLNPEKYKNAKQKPEDPKVITARTGVTPEYAFTQNPIVSTTPSATIALLKMGEIKNVDVVPSDSTGTALNASAYGNHLDVVKMLIDKGANVNAEDRDNRSTPIFYAVRNENLAMVKLLVEKGARINRTDGNGVPLVIHAIYDEKPDDVAILRYLLEHGADPTIPDSRGNPLIDMAIINCSLPAVKLLIKSYKVDPDTKGSSEPTILAGAAVASGTDCKEIVKFLLEAGANPWVKYGRADVLYTLNAEHINANTFPSFKDNSAMILQARKSVPKPADFGTSYPDSRVIDPRMLKGQPQTK